MIRMKEKDTCHRIGLFRKPHGNIRPHPIFVLIPCYFYVIYKETIIQRFFENHIIAIDHLPNKK